VDPPGRIHCAHLARKNDSSAIPQPTEWQHIGNEINTAMIFAWSDFVNVVKGIVGPPQRLVSFA